MGLIDDVYGCEVCPRERFGFVLRPNGGGYYTFPPTIGAAGHAPLLFLGINPRRSKTNLVLHKELADYPGSFRVLAANRVPYNGKSGGPRYIAPNAKERHYRPHAKVVTAVFGERAAFEDHAAVTELFLCATEDSSALRVDTSPCAERYLARVLARIHRVGRSVPSGRERRMTSCAGL
jgi:hypothetical protein